MRAFAFEEGRIVEQERPTPDPGPSEALLEVSMAGICATDIELLGGYYGYRGIAGHEFVARVKRAQTAPWLEGQRVVCDINCGCGTCLRCLNGDPRHCQDRSVIGIVGHDGCFAEYLLAPTANLHPVPDTLPDRLAVFTELLAAALEVGQQVHVTGRDRVLVLGDGRLGLLTALGLNLSTPGTILAGHHEAKLALARAQGVETFLLGVDGDAAALVRKHGLFDLVVEATGKADGVVQALDMVRPEGTVVLKTTTRLPSQLDIAKVVVNEISLIGSRCGDMALALNGLSSRRIDVEPLIEAIWPFARFPEAFDQARRPGALKVLLDYSRI